MERDATGRDSATTAGSPLDADSAEVPAGLLSPGEIVAGHRIVRLRGVGGQGVVYEALDQARGRLVALKMPKPGASGESLRRFEREIEVLAALDHAQIPSLYDSGRERGAPWFTMRLVDGPRIVDVPGLSVRHRVRLFLRACAPVQHAHERGVIHRDLKADNIRLDASGIPQVFDFGIAKAEHRPSLTLLPDALGTLDHAAPEQVAGGSGRLSVRSDVYAMGVVLYTMLAGRLPLRIPSSLPAAISMILEQEPPPPSSHGSECGRDLDAICLKALSKSPDDRYAGMRELEQDLERWLTGAAVMARGRSSSYRALVMLRRHRGWFALATGALLVLAAFTVALALRTRQMKVERDRALLEEAKARAVAQAFIGMLEDVEPGTSAREGGSAAELLDRLGRKIIESDEVEPQVKLAVLTAIAGSYTAVGLPYVARTMAREGLELMKREGIGDARQSAMLELELAIALARLDGMESEAEAALRGVISSRSAGAGPQGHETLRARVALAELLLRRGRLDEALAEARAALDGRRADAARGRGTGEALLLVGSVHLARGDAMAALEAADEAASFLAAHLSQGNLGIARLQALRGRALVASGRLDEGLHALNLASVQLERGLGINHPTVRDLYLEMARAQSAAGHHAEAAQRLSDTLELSRMYDGPHTPAALAMRELLAAELDACGRGAEAQVHRAEADLLRNRLELAR